MSVGNRKDWNNCRYAEPLDGGATFKRHNLEEETMLTGERSRTVGGIGITATEVHDPREGDDEQGTPDPGLVMCYAANMTVESLVERLDSGDIFIPHVGRGCNWSMARASRLVESLLLGLPVPNIYLLREHGSGRHMVLDGRQRLLVLQGFYQGTYDGGAFRLTGVCEGLMGKRYGEMDHMEQRQLDKALITVTVVYQPKPEEDRGPVLSVFERLNNGSGRLSSHEMRTAVYEGSLNRLLLDLSSSPFWQVICGRNNGGTASQELILRFFALFSSLSSYRRPMRHFLDTFMATHRNLDHQTEFLFRQCFDWAVATIAETLGPEAIRPEGRLDVPLADAVLVGLARRREQGPIRDGDGLCAAHRRLVSRLRKEHLCKGEATDASRLGRRIAIAQEEFGGVE